MFFKMLNLFKRKCFQEVEEKEDSDSKRSRKSKENGGEDTKSIDPYKDFIHVRARRGQATDSHSLAERVSKKYIFFLTDVINVFIS